MPLGKNNGSQMDSKMEKIAEFYFSKIIKKTKCSKAMSDSQQFRKIRQIKYLPQCANFIRDIFVN